MSDVVWQTLFQVVGFVIVSIVGFFINRKVDIIGKNAEAAHSLANSGRGVLLKAVAVSLRLLAESTKNPEHAAEATRAEEAFLDHQRAQARVDANADKPAQPPG